MLTIKNLVDDRDDIIEQCNLHTLNEIAFYGWPIKVWIDGESKNDTNTVAIFKVRRKPITNQ